MLAQHLRGANPAPSGLFIYDARTLGLSDGTAVGSWADGSGNGLTVTQATTAKKPIYRATGINGNPAVQFAAASAQTLTRASVAFSGTWTAYAVASRTSATSFYGLAALDDGSSVRLMQFRYGNATNAQSIAWNTAGLATDSQAASASVAHVISAVRTTTTVEVFVDGTSGGSTGITGTIPQSGTTTLEIGAITAGFYLDGYIGFVGFYAGAHSTSTRQGIEASLKGAWGTP